MKVSEQGVVVTNPTPLQKMIKERCRNMRHFSEKAKITESMMSHILHGRRKIYPWTEERFMELLDITQEHFRELIGGQKDD